MTDHPTQRSPRVPQNIYDDEAFFAGYKALRQNDTGLNGALEVPAMRALLPVLAGLHVLDLGCGFGDFTRHARHQGAAHVTGVDVSSRMLEEARALTQDARVTYLQASIEEYTPPPESFDLVVSSLALHYVQDYAGAVERIRTALKPGGRLLFSVEHPICTAYPVGWFGDGGRTAQHWPVDRYGEESERSTRWFVEGVVKYHRTVATYVNTLIQAGFNLVHVGEPAPTPDALAKRPELQEHCRRPPFLLLAADKAKG